MGDVRKRTPPRSTGPTAERTNERTNEFPPVVAPRARRIAEVVAGVVSSATDFRSLDDLCGATSVGVAERTLRRWCRAEGLTAHDLRDFARLLRAVSLSRGAHVAPGELLDLDNRTLMKLLERGGVADLANTGMTMAEFCRRQRFVGHPLVLKEIARLLGFPPAEF